MKKTYIVQNHLENSLLKALLKEEKRSFLYNIELVDPQVFFAKFITEASFLDQYQILQNLELKLFKNNQKDLSFLNELLQHKKDLDLYKVDLDTLDVDDELKMILKALKPLDFKALDLFLEKEDYSEYIIAEGTYSLFEETIFDHMLQKGATRFHFNKHISQKTLTLALNERQEIEQVAQYIIQQDLKLEEVAIELLNPLNASLVKATLKRYKLPFKMHQKETSFLAKRFIALLNFILKPNFDHYVDIIKCNTFTPSNLEMMEYLKRHLDKDDFLKEMNHLQTENNHYQVLEQKASLIHEKTYPLLLELLKIDDYKERLRFIFQKISDGSKASKQIKSVLIENPELLKIEYAEILKRELSKIKEENLQSEGIVVYEGLKMTDRPYIFVLDASNNYYPNFQSKSGLINERILKNTSYPSLELRLAKHLKNLEYLDHSIHTFYLCAQTSFQGKSIQISSLVEKLERLEMEMVEFETNFHFKHHLNPEVAQNLFLENNVLKASVSALEQYMRCPYAYFLNYGLKLKEPRILDFMAATSGTIIHEVFEKLILKYGKDYVFATTSDLDECLNPYKERFLNLYPNEKAKAELVFELFKKAILLEFNYLKKMEENTDFSPIHTELRFKERVFDTNVELVGSIDRIDEFNGTFRIYDYKTSTHKISKSDVECGLQLQLLTYLFIYANLFNREAYGAYYINTNHPRKHIPHYEYKISAGILEKDYDDQEFLKSHRLQGAIFNEDEESEFIVGRKTFDYERYAEGLKVIYEAIYKKISEGDISLTPIDGACTYCKYRDICRFKGGEHFKRPCLYDLGGRHETE